MTYDFKERAYLVTGAGRNIGRTIAIDLVKNGAKVYALDFNSENLEDFVKDHPSVVALHQDLRNWNETAEKLDKLKDIDGLVNCAGIFGGFISPLEVSKESLDKYFDINLNAPINLMQVIGKKMIAKGDGGSIVNISSCSSKGASKASMPYKISKSGLDMATKMFALELGPYNIRVNSVNPGMIRTDMTRPVTSDDRFQRLEALTPLGRLVEIQTVVNLVLFLLSDQSKMITGTNTLIDGGYTCQLPS